MDYLAADGISQDDMLLRATEEGSAELPWFSGAHVYPLYPGTAARCVCACVCACEGRGGGAEGAAHALAGCAARVWVAPAGGGGGGGGFGVARPPPPPPPPTHSPPHPPPHPPRSFTPLCTDVPTLKSGVAEGRRTVLALARALLPDALDLSSYAEEEGNILALPQRAPSSSAARIWRRYASMDDFAHEP